jgi:hypothetical protein
MRTGAALLQTDMRMRMGLMLYASLSALRLRRAQNQDGVCAQHAGAVHVLRQPAPAAAHV